MLPSKPYPSDVGSPVCSILVANYNGMATLDACLASVFNQSIEHPFEVIVHDDASSDGSVEWIKGYYPNVRLIESQENVGFCVGNNRMAAIAQGRYLLLLNNDAELRPGALRRLFDYVGEDRFDGILTLAQYEKPTGRLLDIGSRLDPFLNPVPNLGSNRRKVAMGMGACLWVPRELWNEIGGFPEWFGSLAEDMYLCLATWTLGREVHALADSGYDHWVGASFGGGKAQGKKLNTTFRRRGLSERNKTYILAIFTPLPLLLLILPLHLLLLAIEGGLLSLLRWDGDYWRRIYWPALQGPWLERQRLWRERYRWQRARRASVWRFLSCFTPWPYKLRMLIRHGLPKVR